MSNNKKKPVKHICTFPPVKAFDNHAQFEKTLDDIVNRLNAHVTAVTSYNEEVVIVGEYLFHPFGDNDRTKLKIRDILLYLDIITEHESAYLF
ncbi:hypothetical protein [Photobacterium phosphoreum]|uniref:hypothetical protein n=1 Tax=Photobacterium phosphoreum TaxID=659 RepID=UPI000D171926|nr:hypothetical protein [Photobacterium phosphoreum]PSU71329.1 hypothetical protein CTM67_20105 [Photobacterium phosphoreum]